jgi:hypothetical protein
MKRTAKILLRLLAVLGVCFAAITFLEMFGLHPQVNVGNFHAIWLGVKHMDFESGYGDIQLTNGHKETQRDFDLGPIKVTLVHDF